MKLVLAAILAALVQTSLIYFNWILFFVLGVGMVSKERYLSPFLSGLILDLFIGLRPGVSSLFFLFIVFILCRLRLHLPFDKIVIVLIFSFLAELLFGFVRFGSWLVGKSVVFAFVFLVVFIFFLKGKVEEKRGLKIKL